MAWTAESLANYMKKGSLIAIDGRLQTRNYENQEKKRVYVTEVVAESVQFLEGKKDNGNSGSGNGSYNNNQSNNQRNSTYTKIDDPFSSNGQTIDISDDDLPF